MRCAPLLLLCGCGRVFFDPVGENVDPADIESNLVFLTRTQPVAGQLGGVANADAICASEAAIAGLPGTYIAFLSSTTTSAISRLDGARGWTRVDGAPFADRVEDIVAGRIISAPSVLADGTKPGASLEAITGSTSAGEIGTTDRCGEYMQTFGGAAEYGRASAASNVFIRFSDQASCTFSWRFYCFGIARNVPVSAPTNNAGRRAFVSSPWAPSGGLAGADAHCQSEAAANGLSGTYLALLSTSTSSAATRFSANGARWVRRDGMVLADPAESLLLPRARPKHPLNVAADGNYVGGINDRTWTGARFVEEGSLDTCMDWTSSAAENFGMVGRTDHEDQNWFDAGMLKCDVPSRLYCLQR